MICQETGVTFAGPWVLGTLACLAKNSETRDWALREGQRVLSEHVCVSHNYIYFYRYAMDALLAAQLWAEAERYALKLEEYTRAEPLPVCDFPCRAHSRISRPWSSASTMLLSCMSCDVCGIRPN